MLDSSHVFELIATRSPSVQLRSYTHLQHLHSFMKHFSNIPQAISCQATCNLEVTAPQMVILQKVAELHIIRVRKLGKQHRTMHGKLQLEHQPSLWLSTFQEALCEQPPTEG